MGSNRLKRKTDTKSVRPIFIIASEGEITEPSYFKQLKVISRCSIEIVKNNGSSPLCVLKSLKLHLSSHPMNRTDEAWVVIDRDVWSPNDINKVADELIKMRGNCSLAVSNPRFEFWVLLHFEEAKGVCTPSECELKLKRHLPNYKKDLSIHCFQISEIREAIERAKRIGETSCKWPLDRGTTVYRLVEKLLGS